jgi:serpin B
MNGTPFQLARLPYAGGRLGLLILLPQAGADPYIFASGLSADALADWTSQLEPQPLNIALPRFTTRYSGSLIPALSTLGMSEAFTPTADFSPLAPGFSLNVVWHATSIEVDEAGTVAAGGTGVGQLGAEPETFNVRADHPFIYFIQDAKTGAILFLGLLANPLAG